MICPNGKLPQTLCTSLAMSKMAREILEQLGGLFNRG